MRTVKKFLAKLGTSDIQGAHGFAVVEDIHLHGGGGGGGGDTQTVQKADPWKGQQPYLKDIFKQSQDLYNNYAPEYFPGSTVAPLSGQTGAYLDALSTFHQSPYQQNLIGQGLDNVNYLSSLGTNLGTTVGVDPAVGGLDYLNQAVQQNNASDTFARMQQSQINPQDLYNIPQTGETQSQQLAGQLLGNDPGQNPYVDELVQRTLAANTQNFNDRVLPAIGDTAQSANQFGGSRQGIAEGLATERLNDSNLRTAAQIYTDQYGQDIARQLQAAGQADQSGLAAIQADRGFGLNLGNAYLNATNQDLGRQLQAAGMEGQYGLNATGAALDQYNQGLNFGLQGHTRASAMLPQMQQMPLTGYNLLGQAGSAYDQYAQAQLADEASRWNYYQQQPQDSFSKYVAAINGFSGLGGQTTTTQSGGGGSSSTAGALGGALTGLGLTSSMFGTAGAGSMAAMGLAGPPGWAVLAGSALLGSGIL